MKFNIVEMKFKVELYKNHDIWLSDIFVRIWRETMIHLIEKEHRAPKASTWQGWHA